MSVLALLESDKHALVVSELIKDRLYFVTFKNKTYRNTTNIHYFSIDDELVYENYYEDFGPLNLAAVSKYLNKVNYKLNTPSLASKAIVHFTSLNERKRVNAAFLMAVFGMLYLNMTPTNVFNKLSFLKYPYLSFQEAIDGESNYKIRLIDCINSVQKAISFGFINFDDFNTEEYEKMDSMKSGDLNWIVPETLLAFAGPVDNPTDNNYDHPPEFFLDYFHRNNVTTVIRLNFKMYNAKAFTNAGISHYDLYFKDGSAPSPDILARFFEITENSSGAVAVHCKAGLGRTGSLIGAYLVKHYRFTALEAIAWLRICRPACIIGPQQTWLQDMEPMLWSMGEFYRKRYLGGAARIIQHKCGIYTRSPGVLGAGGLRVEQTEDGEQNNVTLADDPQGDMLLLTKK